MCFRLKDWGAALTNYQKVLTSLGEDETEERASVYYKLGCVKREQGQAKQAINNFEKALAVDPAHRPTLEALVALYTELKDWKQVVAYKRQILDNVFEADERFRMLNEIADVWNDNDKNPLKAIEALEEARELQPVNTGLLHKLIALYQATENWSKMIDTLQAIADSEKDAGRKSKFLYTMAQLYRDKEGDQDKAVELFSEALDLNPQYLEAFERINKILTGKKDWKALERAFRKMLRRMSTANIVEPGSRVQPLAQPRPHLPRPPEGHDERASRPSRWRRASSRTRPSSARSSPSSTRRPTRPRPPSASTRSSCRRTRCASIRIAASTSSTCGCTSTTARGACAPRSRSCARRTRRSSASSRTTARAG